MAEKTKKPKPNAPTRTKEAIAAAKGPANSYIYTEAMGEEICRRLARGEGLKPICRTPGFPHSATVLEWAADTSHSFSARYTQARTIGWMHLAEEVLEIADDKSGDVTTDENGNKAWNHENIARSRLKVDTRKWLLARVLPKIYGDRVTTEHTGPNGAPVQLDVKSQVNIFLEKLDAISRRQKELQAIEVAEQESADERQGTNRHR